ncbi:MAG: diguanylate cyclase [bacterium]
MFHDVFIFSLHAVGMMALCTVSYGMIQRRITTKLVRHLLFGLIMGTAAATLMFQPIMIADGFQMDGRGVFIGIAATFGGPIAAAVAAAITVLTRVAIGGGGAFLGCCVILGTAALASLWSTFRGRKYRRSLLDWCSLAAVLILPLFSIVFAPIPNRGEALLFLLCLTVGNLLIFGRLMEAEQRRGRRERELNSAAHTDSLTQLPNRRSFLVETSAAEVGNRTSKGLLLVDIDHFKKVNDTYGHDAGDEVLRIVGQKLAELTRKSDVVARFGGEEFALLVDAADETDLGNIADRVRQALDLNVVYNKSAIALSVSIGGAFCGDRPFRFDQAYMDADKSLYHAKKAGRAMSVISRLAA